MKNDIEIGKLFEQRYVLDPILQRSYEWDTDRVINLINDIQEIKFNGIRGGKCRYNIGDFITYKTDELDDFKKVCDGQQRLTTLVLTLANILHHHPSLSIKGSIEDYLIKTIRDENGRKQTVPILQLKKKDNEILEKIIASGIDGLTKEDKKSHLVKVYKKISERFTDKMSEKELDNFFESIYRNASYFERECESQEEAIKQFNNLNGGQQSISKSRVGIATLYGIYNEMHTNQEIEHFLYELSNMDTKKAKEFLCLYIYYRADECRESDIPKTIHNLHKKNSNILNDIVSFYNDIYVKHIEKSTNTFMLQSSLRQIWVDLYTDKYPQIKDVDDTEKNITYKKCEWGYICNRIKNGGSGDKNLYAGLFKNFNESYGKLSEYVISKLNEKGLYEPVSIINTYKQNKSNHGNELFIRLLSVVEEEFQKDMGIKELVTHRSKPTLEHIHPQNPRTDEEYECDDTIVNRFGNKTIIGDEANKSLSNKSYIDKREYYMNSPYHINSKHLCNFDHWTNDSVEHNEKFYFEMLNKHYGLNSHIDSTI